MKKAPVIICIAALFAGLACFAEDDSSYRDKISDLLNKTEELTPHLNDNTLNYKTFERWYNDFKSMQSDFISDFSRLHKKQKSFQLTSQGIDRISSAWSAFHRADDNEKMFLETIASNDVNYAHKWKDSAIAERKNACAMVAEGAELLKSAKDALAEEAGQ